MRTARELVDEYRRQGHHDSHIRALADERPPALRGEILALLEPAADASAAAETPESVFCVLFEPHDDAPLAEAAAGEAVDPAAENTLDDLPIPLAAQLGLLADNAPASEERNGAAPAEAAIPIQPPPPAQDAQAAEYESTVVFDPNTDAEAETAPTAKADDPEANALPPLTLSTADEPDSAYETFLNVLRGATPATDTPALPASAETAADASASTDAEPGAAPVAAPAAADGPPRADAPAIAEDPGAGQNHNDAADIPDADLGWTAASDRMPMNDECSQVVAFRPPWMVAPTALGEEEENSIIRIASQVEWRSLLESGDEKEIQRFARAGREAGFEGWRDRAEAIIRRAESADRAAAAPCATLHSRDTASWVQSSEPALAGVDSAAAGSGELNSSPDDARDFEAAARDGDADGMASASAAQTRFDAEIAELRGWVAEIGESLRRKEKELSGLSGLLAARDETLKLQNDELSRLRDALAQQNEAIDSIHEERREFRQTLQEHDRLRAQCDQLTRIAIPTLETRGRELERERDDFARRNAAANAEIASAHSRRRTGYAAAAASLLIGACAAWFSWQTGGRETGELRRQLASVDKARRDAEIHGVSSRQETDSLQRRCVALDQELQQQRSQNHANQQAMLTWKTRAEDVGARLANLTTTLARLQAEGDARMATVAAPSRGSTPVAAIQANVSQWPAVAATTPETPMATAALPTEAEVLPGEGVAQVLLRVRGTQDPQTVMRVARMNNLSLDIRGYPRVQPGQVLRLPSGVEDEVGARETAQRR